MRRTASNEHGFAAIEAIVIVIILAIIGFIGWYVWHSKQAADNNLTATNESTHASTPQPVPLNDKDSTVLVSSDGKISMRLPNSWAIISSNEGPDNCGFVDQPADETCLNFIVFSPTKTNPDNWYVKFFKTSLGGKVFFDKNIGEQCADVSTIQVTMKSGTSVYQGKFDNSHCSGYRFYVVSNGSYTAYFDSAESSTLADKYQQDFLKIVSSVTFVKQ